MPFSPFQRLFRSATTTGYYLGLLVFLLCFWHPVAQAAAGPFAGFTGQWSGTGDIRQSGNAPERIRCSANYRVRGSSAQDVDLQLRCTSDNYNFDLSGNFETAGSNQISGRWTERTRNIGGTVTGIAIGDRIQIHVESPALTANLLMVTRGRRQTVTIDSQGGGQAVRASITLHRS